MMNRLSAFVAVFTFALCAMCREVNPHRPPAVIPPSVTRLLNERYRLLTLSVAKRQRTRRR